MRQRARPRTSKWSLPARWGDTGDTDGQLLRSMYLCTYVCRSPGQCEILKKSDAKFSARKGNWLGARFDVCKKNHPHPVPRHYRRHRHQYYIVLLSLSDNYGVLA